MTQQTPRYAPHPSMQPAQLGQPVPAGPSEQGAKPRRPFAIAAVVVAGVKLLASPVQAVAIVNLLASGGLPSGLGAVSMLINVISAVLALVATGLAIVSIVRRERANLLAGIAIGIAIATLVAMTTGVLQGAVLSYI